MVPGLLEQSGQLLRRHPRLLSCSLVTHPGVLARLRPGGRVSVGDLLDVFGDQAVEVHDALEIVEQTEVWLSGTATLVRGRCSTHCCCSPPGNADMPERECRPCARMPGCVEQG